MHFVLRLQQQIGAASSRARGERGESSTQPKETSRAEASLRALINGKYRPSEKDQGKPRANSLCESISRTNKMRIQQLELMLTYDLSADPRKSIEADIEARSLLLTTSRSIARRDYIGALAAEVLTQIFDELSDPATLCAVRLVCRLFEQAAWHAFARSFNHQVFHPTDRSLECLEVLSKNEIMARHFKQLSISTVKLVYCGPRTTDQTYHQEMETYQRPPGITAPHNAAQFQWLKERQARENLRFVLRRALANLHNLETICIVDDDEIPSLREPTTGEITREEADETSSISKAANFIPMSVKLWLTLKREETPARACSNASNTARMAKAAGHYTAVHLLESASWLFERKAHRHAVDVVFKSLRQPPNDSSIPFLPKLREFKTQGRVNIASLSGCPCRRPIPLRCPGLPQVTRLELAVTTLHQKHDFQETTKDLRQYIPDFLAGMPNLTDLKLDFQPREYTKNAWERENLRELPWNPLGFSAIAATVTLLHLKNLHLANLSHYEMDKLIYFLHKHRTTLTTLTFECVGFELKRWREFCLFLARHMSLDSLVHISKCSEAQKKASWRKWRKIGKELRPTDEEVGATSKTGITWVDMAP